MISVALQHHRYTHIGIVQNQTFSVNVPSVDQVREVDYCGIVSGSRANKTKVCGFEIFYGKLKNAPLIKKCPINLECKVVHILDLGSHSLIVGRIEETHVSDGCLTKGKPDVKKIKPFIYATDTAREYYSFGQVIAKGYNIGRELEARD